MTQRINNPAERFFDESGDVLSLGKLDFYEPLTTQVKETFSDPEMMDENDPVVTLDEYGVVPDVFIEGAYKARLRSSGNVQKWNRDFINPYNLAPFDEWSSGVIYSEGADNIVTWNGKYYISISDDNLDKDPETSPEEWKEVRFLIGEFNKQNVSDLGKIPPARSNIIIGVDSRWSSMLAGGMSSDYIGGMSTACHPSLAAATGVSIAAGSCADDQGVMIASSSSVTKLITLTWAPGTGEGGRATGVALTNLTWYFLFAVIIDGGVDFIFDTSPACQNGVSGNGVEAFRMIAAVRTDSSSQIEPYIQYGRRFIFEKYLSATITAPDTAGDLSAIASPVGIEAPVTMLIRKTVSSPSISGTDYIILIKTTSPAQDDVPVTIANSDVGVRDTSTGGISYASQSVIRQIVTDTSSRIRARSALTNILSSGGAAALTISFIL